MANSKFLLQKVGASSKFILVGPDGQVLLTSKLYSDNYSCKQGIELIRQNINSDKVFEKTKTQDGLFYYNFRLPNRELLAVSEMFAEKEELIENIEQVKAVSLNAEIIER